MCLFFLWDSHACTHRNESSLFGIDIKKKLGDIPSGLKKPKRPKDETDCTNVKFNRKALVVPFQTVFYKK